MPPDAEIDLDNPQVVIDGEASDAEAVLAGTDTRIKRTTVLAIDTSASMAGGRFKAAKAAARAFIESVPDDVFVGIVTFDAQVNEALVPTTDRDQARAVLGSLSLSKDTRLYDGVLTALEMAGTEGQRSVLVLSDGADTSKTTIGSVTEAIEASETSIDVVALEQDADQIGPLRQLADAGAGRVISSDSDELSAAFADEAAILASQVLVTAQVPDSVTSSQASIAVTLPSATGDIYATAYSTIESAKKKSAKDKTATEVALPRQDEAGKTTPDWLIYAGVGVLGLGLLMLLLMLVPAKRKPLTAAERIATYGAAGSGITPSADQDEEAVLTTAMHAAEELLEHNRGLDARISPPPRGRRQRAESVRVAAAARRGVHRQRRARRPDRQGQRARRAGVPGLRRRGPVVLPLVPTDAPQEGLPQRTPRHPPADLRFAGRRALARAVDGHRRS